MKTQKIDTPNGAIAVHESKAGALRRCSSTAIPRLARLFAPARRAARRALPARRARPAGVRRLGQCEGSERLFAAGPRAGRPRGARGAWAHRGALRRLESRRPCRARNGARSAERARLRHLRRAADRFSAAGEGQAFHPNPAMSDGLRRAHRPGPGGGPCRLDVQARLRRYVRRSSSKMRCGRTDARASVSAPASRRAAFATKSRLCVT